jgi:predicted hydrocarbon binding protein
MNYSRADLVQATSASNQMRNAVYHLIRFMRREKVEDIRERLRRMGKNIALTFSRYWLPNVPLTKETLKSIVKDIYQTIFKSKIVPEVDFDKKILRITDSKCCLCKYNYPDIEIAGCEVIEGLLPTYIDILNKQFPQRTTISLRPSSVLKSKAVGDIHCLQQFEIIVK